MNKLYIVGSGSGTYPYILPVALKKIKESDIIVTSKRIAQSLKIDNYFNIIEIYKNKMFLHNLLIKNDVTVIVSGDPLMYSMYRTMKKNINNIEIEVIPGISSLQLAGCKFEITMEDAKILSLHEKSISEINILNAIANNKKIFFLCSKDNGPVEIAKIVDKYNLNNIEICVGSNFGLENESLERHYSSYYLENYTNPELCVLIVLNKNNEILDNNRYFLKDNEFYRNSTPMTNENIRAIVISKLELDPCSILWDIGAGTGSISIQASKFCNKGLIYAIDNNNKSIEAITENVKLFNVKNVIIVKNNILDFIYRSDVEKPDRIFIGGAGSELEELLIYVRKMPKTTKIVITSVTLESKNIIFYTLKDIKTLDITEVMVGKVNQIGNYNLINNGHTIDIFTFYGEGEEDDLH